MDDLERVLEQGVQETRYSIFQEKLGKAMHTAVDENVLGGGLFFRYLLDRTPEECVELAYKYRNSDEKRNIEVQIASKLAEYAIQSKLLKEDFTAAQFHIPEIGKRITILQAQVKPYVEQYSSVTREAFELRGKRDKKRFSLIYRIYNLLIGDRKYRQLQKIEEELGKKAYPKELEELSKQYSWLKRIISFHTSGEANMVRQQRKERAALYNALIEKKYFINAYMLLATTPEPAGEQSIAALANQIKMLQEQITGLQKEPHTVREVKITETISGEQLSELEKKLKHLEGQLNQFAGAPEASRIEELQRQIDALKSGQAAPVSTIIVQQPKEKPKIEKRFGGGSFTLVDRSKEEKKEEEK